MSLLKQRISSPLEAGPSLLDTQILPPRLTQALGYASERLCRKGIHVTLLVVRREYQLPLFTPTCASPFLSSVPTPVSPDFTSAPVSPSRFSLRRLVRRGTGSSTASSASTTSPSASESFPSPRSAAISPTFSPFSPRGLPLTPLTPMTPPTPASTASTAPTPEPKSGVASHPCGIRLVHATPLSPREERVLRHTIVRAEQKFQVGVGWLPSAITASDWGPNADLVRRSIRQNDVVFSSEGLTVLSLDRLYTFKAALAAYARTTLPPSHLATPLADSTTIEDVVDELRRLVLANGGKQVPTSELHSSYAWIGVSASALCDVEGMYRRAYGGIEGKSGLAPSEQPVERQATVPIKPPPVVRIGKPPSPKGPILKLQTTFDKPTSPALKTNVEEKDMMSIEISFDGLSSDVSCDEGDVTARPIATGMPFWDGLGLSIDEMLQDEKKGRRAGTISPASQRLGPTTPNGYDDISPVTRGEWSFLFSGEGFGARKATVETC